jgi:hypothetical protein
MTAFAGASLTNTYTTAQLNGSESYACPQIGQRLDALDKSYRFVQYNAGAGAIAAVAGNIVGFYAPGGVSTGVTNVVSSDVSDTIGVGAGMLMAVIANGDYGWIQTKGLATITPALVSGADGNALTLSSTTDGTLKVCAAVTDAECAVAIDASAKIIMLKCAD